MHPIGIYLKKIHTQMERRRNCHYREYNLTSTQLDLMEYLYFHDGQQSTLSDISSFFGVQHTSVIHVLKVLEKKGFIRKEECRQGSRCKPILLTQKGKDIIQLHRCCPSDIESVLFANIPQEHLLILEQSLRQIYENLMHDAPDDPPSGQTADHTMQQKKTENNSDKNALDKNGLDKNDFDKNDFDKKGVSQ